MENNKVDMFLMSNSDKLPAEMIPMIREKLLAADEDKYAVLCSMELQNPTVILILSLLLGSLGIDRFMLGDIGMGVLKLLTGGVCGILTIIDWFTVMKKAKQNNANKILQFF